MIKKSLLIILIGIMLTSLYGCNKASDEPQTNNSQTESETNSEINSETSSEESPIPTEPFVGLLSEYIASHSGTPRYFVYNFDTNQLEELTQSNLYLVGISKAIHIYYGNSPVPMPHEYLVHVDTLHDESIASRTLSSVIEEIQSYEVVAYEPDVVIDDGFVSFDKHPVASQEIIDILIADGYPAEHMNFSYKEWIDASNFPNNMCTDTGLLWVLSLINDEIGGDLLDCGKILSEKALLKELNVQILPHTDIVGIINHETHTYCIIARVHNETDIIERTNVATTVDVFSNYQIPSSSGDSTSTESMSVYAVGPYVWMLSLGDTQKIQDRFYYLFDYLYELSHINQDAGHTSYDNYWN